MWVTVKNRLNGKVYPVGKSYYNDHKTHLELVEGEAVPEEKTMRPKAEKSLEEIMDTEVDPEIEAVRDALDAKGIKYHPNAKLETLKNKLEAAE